MFDIIGLGLDNPTHFAVILKLTHAKVIKWYYGGTSYPSRSTLSCHVAAFLCLFSHSQIPRIIVLYIKTD